jgi:hypothetical protein
MAENYIETKQRLLTICEQIFEKIGWRDLEWRIDDPDNFCSTFTLVISFKGATVSTALRTVGFFGKPVSAEHTLPLIADTIGYLAWVRAKSTVIELDPLLNKGELK